MKTDFYFNKGDKIYFTSDTHFNHKNILMYTNRKKYYSNMDEMIEDFISRWNNVVPKDGIVFHLGDVGMGKNEELRNILNRLNGKKYLIMGNHDRKNLSENTLKCFEGIYQQLYISIEGQKIYLNHVPFLCYDGVYRTNPTWQLFGHVHTEKEGNSEGQDMPRLVNLYPMQYDVGVDNNDYTPISFYCIRKIIKENLKNI